jgi:hypothetical protein
VEPKGSEIHKNGSAAPQIRESSSKFQDSTIKQNGNVGTCNGINGNSKTNIFPSSTKEDTCKLLESAVKQNGIIDKSKGGNVSSCCADQGQGVHHVRFNIVKPTLNGQNRKVANGRAENSSISADRHSNGQHILSNGNSNHGSHNHSNDPLILLNGISEVQENLKRSERSSSLHMKPDHEHKQINGKRLSGNDIDIDEKVEVETRFPDSLAASPSGIGMKRKLSDERFPNTNSCNASKSMPCSDKTENEHKPSKWSPVEKLDLEGLKLW